MFDYGICDFSEFVDYMEANLAQPCPPASEYARTRTWENVGESPPEFGYHLLLWFKDVQGPMFRAGTVQVIGKDPFWSARAWMTVPGLTKAEYDYLFSRCYQRYQDTFGKRVEEGSLTPGSRAIVW